MAFSPLQLEACRYLFEQNNGKQLSLVEENILSQTGIDQFEVKELINLIVDGLNDGAYHDTQTHSNAYFVLGKAFNQRLLVHFQAWLKIELGNQDHQAVYQLMIALDNLGAPVFDKKARGNGIAANEVELNLRDAENYLYSLSRYAHVIPPNQLSMTHQFTFASSGKYKGLLLSYKEVKKGNFVEATPSEARTLMTTMLTDIPTELWTFCRKLSTDVQRKIIKPNGFMSGTLIIEYSSGDFQIEIKRKLKSSFIVLLFPSHAELPTSYHVEVQVNTQATEVAEKIKDFLQEITQGRIVELEYV